MVKISLRQEREKHFIRSNRIGPEGLWEWNGLVKLSVEAGSIGEECFGEQAGLINLCASENNRSKLSEETDRGSQDFNGSR